MVITQCSSKAWNACPCYIMDQCWISISSSLSMGNNIMVSNCLWYNFDYEITLWHDFFSKYCKVFCANQKVVKAHFSSKQLLAYGFLTLLAVTSPWTAHPWSFAWSDPPPERQFHQHAPSYSLWHLWYLLSMSGIATWFDATKDAPALTPSPTYWPAHIHNISLFKVRYQYIFFIVLNHIASLWHIIKY